MQNTLKRIRKKMYLIKTTLLFDELFLFKLELLTLSLEFLRSIKNEKLTLLLKAWKVTTKLPHWQWKYLLPETDGSGMSILGTTSRTQFIPFYQQLAFHFLIWLHLLPVHCVHWGLNYQTDWGVRDHCLSSHHCFSLNLETFPNVEHVMIYQKWSWLDVQICNLSWTCLQYDFFIFAFHTLYINIPPV